MLFSGIVRPMSDSNLAQRLSRLSGQISTIIVGKQPQIEYVEMPQALRDKYQYFTQAEMAKLRRAGYQKPFTALEAAVEDYAGYLKDKTIW